MHTHVRLVYVCMYVYHLFHEIKTVYRGINLEVKHTRYSLFLILSALCGYVSLYGSTLYVA